MSARKRVKKFFSTWQGMWLTGVVTIVGTLLGALEAGPTLRALLPQETYKLPYGGSLQQAGLNIIRMEACRIHWNQLINDENLSPDDFWMEEPIGVRYQLGDISGTKFSYTISSLSGRDICGSYFIPDKTISTKNADWVERQIADNQRAVLDLARQRFSDAAAEITQIKIQKARKGEFDPGLSMYWATFASVEYFERTASKFFWYENGIVTDGIFIVTDPPKTKLSFEEVPPEDGTWTFLFSCDKITCDLRRKIAKYMGEFDNYNSEISADFMTEAERRINDPTYKVVLE